MENAKTELLEALANKAELKCAKIRTGETWDDEGNKEYKLKIGYNNADLETFLNSLDFDYDSGYGGQELFGTLWLKDGTWLSRGEYDGSEWWKHNTLPEITDDLI
jgi:hypothetical protein